MALKSISLLINFDFLITFKHGPGRLFIYEKYLFETSGPVLSFLVQAFGEFDILKGMVKLFGPTPPFNTGPLARDQILCSPNISSRCPDRALEKDSLVTQAIVTVGGFFVFSPFPLRDEVVCLSTIRIGRAFFKSNFSDSGCMLCV